MSPLDVVVVSSSRRLLGAPLGAAQDSVNAYDCVSIRTDNRNREIAVLLSMNKRKELVLTPSVP